MDAVLDTDEHGPEILSMDTSGPTSGSPHFRINDLPEELFAKVLTLWARADEDGPWMAALVCQHWRRTVLNCSEAWSHITVRLEPEPETDPTWCIEEEDIERAQSSRGKRRPISKWIERARESELSLLIAARSTFPRLGLEIGQTLILFSGCVQLVRHLSLEVQSGILAGSILEVLAGLAGNYHLHHLEISVLSVKRGPKQLRGNPEGLTLEDFWNSAPLANHLVFRGCLPPPLAAATHQFLRSLVLENVSADFTGILTSMPSIRFLDLSCGSQSLPPDLNRPTPLKTMLLQDLEELRIHEVPTGHCAKLLDSLNTPSLKRLTIGNFGVSELRTLWESQPDAKWYDLMDVYGSALSAFAGRTPAIEAVRLLRSPVDDRHFIRLLEHLPGLRELALDALLIGLPAIRGLTPSLTGKRKEEPTLCPRLQNLHIGSCDSIQKQHIIGLIQARNHPKAQCLPILRVGVVECKDFDPADEPSLSSLDAGRLQVAVV